MKLLGAGIDIVELSRIKKLTDKHKDQFLKRILHSQELAEIEDVTNIEAFVAKRFAVKEAASKALGVGIGKQLSFTDMYVEHDNLGKPLLVFTKECRERLNLTNTNTLLTIADEQSYAVAHVLFYSEG